MTAARQIDHPAADAAHAALLGALATRAVQPRDVAQRACFDPDYGVYEAHPLDPRTPEPEHDERDPERGADMAIELIARACRALHRDKAAAADLMREAAVLLGEIADEVDA